MSDAKHTPGPWETVGAKYIWKTGDVGGAVAIIAEPECESSNDFRPVRIASERWEEAMANARLIAAAPELLEALKELRDFYTDNFGLPAAKANAAIAKAEGRES